MDYYKRKFRRSGESLRIGFICFIGIIICLIVGGILSSCKTYRSTERTEIRDSVRIKDSLRITDSTNVTNKIVIKDSTRIKDSTVIILDSAGNIKQIKEYHNKEVHHTEKDSTAYYRNLFNDAIHELVAERSNKKEVKVAVEKELAWWQKGLMVTGALCWAIFIIWVLASVIKSRKLF